MRKKIVAVLGLCALTGAIFFGVASTHAATVTMAYISTHIIAMQDSMSQTQVEVTPTPDPCMVVDPPRTCPVP